MKKYNILLLVLLFISANVAGNERDTIQSISLQELNIISSKETNLQNAPVASSYLLNEKIEQTQVFSVKDVSAKVPNFFIPDYGSAMSSSPYVRGVGSRFTGQSIALYVDNVPYLEKTAFDFELFDIAQIEVLRGPQGTLYGRNSIGGVVNIQTLSPQNYQGGRLKLSFGNYGQKSGQYSIYRKVSPSLALSLGVNYKKHDGFYTNTFTNKSVDAEEGAAARAKIHWGATSRLKFDFTSDFDYIDQGAFPYGLYNSHDNSVSKPNFNDISNYYRRTWNNSMLMRYIFDNMVATFSLSHQHFKDQMDIDQDFTPESIFTLRQSQDQKLLNAEALLKSNSNSKYKWIFGMNGFAQQHDMDAPVKFKRDGIEKIIQPHLPPIAKITNEEIDIPGTYDTNRKGAALFHQSTLDGIFVDGLSATIGLRLDVEKVVLDYDASSEMTISMATMPNPISRPVELNGSVDLLFTEVLPKFSLKYEWDRGNFLYGSLAKGYKPGGFNIHEISDIVRDILNPQNGAPEPDEVKQRIMFTPELSWDYEIGWNNVFLNRRVNTNLTLFFMKINGLQLTEFLESGAGRKLTNAGKAISKGVEASVFVDLGKGFNWDVNYGLAHASFKHYQEIQKIDDKEEVVDYKGKFVPYAPQHTLNSNLSYSKKLNNQIVDGIFATLSYSGVGKIYWYESNDLYQNFYNLFDSKVGVKRDKMSIDLWVKNIFNTKYNVFYFESFGNKFFQQGKPTQMGLSLSIEL